MQMITLLGCGVANGFTCEKVLMLHFCCDVRVGDVYGQGVERMGWKS